MGDDRATAEILLGSAFATLPDLVHAHAAERPGKPAIVCGGQMIDYAGLDAQTDRIAAALQREGLKPGESVAILAGMSIDYGCLFLGALRAGCVPAPLAPSATAAQLAAMIADSGARILFLDAQGADALGDVAITATRIALDDSGAGQPLAEFLAPEGTVPAPVAIAPGDPFNLIYSSGTTGTPKGIVQPHAMRWFHIARAPSALRTAVTMIATPLYSNTTLVSFLPTLGWGGTAILIPKFDARDYLAQAERHRATIAMLVPVQYQRIMALPDFDGFDLSSFQLKTCTSAPFAPALKADVLARWPGLLVEYYGMTEGGGTTVLVCNARPDKLHTVGTPIEGHDIRLIDDAGREVAPGEPGEVVGRSPAMMSGYHGRADATGDAIWHDAEGRAFIRHGDIGRFDAEGFLTLIDRKKDMIISGGFNLYPSDLEAVLAGHPGVSDCSVIGIPSDKWGETPVGFYVGDADPGEAFDWFNTRVARTQRLSALERLDSLPRSPIGKVLKRELRDRYLAS